MGKAALKEYHGPRFLDFFYLHDRDGFCLFHASTLFGNGIVFCRLWKKASTWGEWSPVFLAFVQYLPGLLPRRVAVLVLCRAEMNDGLWHTGLSFVGGLEAAGRILNGEKRELLVEPPFVRDEVGWLGSYHRGVVL